MMRVAANCQPFVSGCRHRGRSARPAWPAATRAVRKRARGLSLLTAGTSETGDTAVIHEDRFTVTTPLYYVNAAPHMGSAYPTIAADTLARYHRLRGRKVAFVTGTDEHGEKIALAAENRGLAAKEHCDAVVQEYKGLWKMLDIQYDSFIRTTDAKHEALVLQILERVWAAGDIYKAQYEGWYCVGCEAYLDDTELDEQHMCRTHRTPCQHRREENYFFRLSRYQEALAQLVLENDGGFIEPGYRGNEVAGWVKSGLRDFSISRAAVEWGIRIPRDPAQTVYVWFDALIGYLSGLLPPGVEPSPAALQQHGWPADVHIIGKDILRFHAVYWPAMLMSAGLPLPAKVYGHGFLTKDGLKMGKSLGNVLDPVALVQAYGPDAVRFYLMNEITFGADGDFSEERFRSLVNSSLANGIGNLLNRTLSLLKKNCSSTLPHGASSIPADNPLRQVAERAPAAAANALESMKFREAAEAALEIAGRGNQYLEETAPWTALKKGTDEEKAAAALVLVAVLEALRIISVLLFPFTPSLSRRIHLQLGLEEAALDGICWDDAQWGQLQAGHTFPKPTPVFVRLEGDLVFTSANAATNAAEAAGAVPQVS